MSTPYYIPETNVPLPPKSAEVITTACDYCIVACGYKVYRWPVAGGHDGGPKAEETPSIPTSPSKPWALGWRPTSTISCCTMVNRTMW